jgi:hypothetical protein
MYATNFMVRKFIIAWCRIVHYTSIYMAKLLDINGLSEYKGLPVRKLRHFVATRKIPFLKCGHRTLLFDPEKVDKALQRFEVPAVGAK